MRKRQIAAAEKRRTMDLSMTGDDVKMALAALEMENDPHRVARIFKITTRTVWRWQIEGAPPHIALAFEALLSGRVKPRHIQNFLKRVGRSRDDGDRYKPKSMSSEE